VHIITKGSLRNTLKALGLFYSTPHKKEGMAITQLSLKKSFRLHEERKKESK
jgi:hypothetical protein